MEHRQASGDPEEPSVSANGTYDTPDFGTNGLIGDGRYRLTGRLGRGGMAEVFAAEDVRLGRTVAVKLLRADLAEDSIAKARFTREAQSVAGLNHHAVVAVYDSGEDRMGSTIVPYIVMELVDGHTIRDLLLSEETPPLDQALAIVSGVLEALAYSHQHGIVHRDIKPANVIITTTGAVKVMDFGIARALHGASTTMTQTGMVMGTPQYLSPEQALGKTVDHRSDLYATGCLLYELLTLRPPFTGETPLSVVYQHVQDNPQVPSTVSNRVPPELDGLVLRSLAKNPDDRFQSAEEMYGLVQYALRMLSERGGWSGSWDTGYVDHHATASPTAGTTALPHPQSGHTAELGPPLLMGPPPGRGNNGYDYDGYGDGGDSHRGRKVALVLLAALLAVGLGVFIAINAANNGSKNPSSSNSTGPSATDSSTPSPTPTDTGLPTDQTGSSGQTGSVLPPTQTSGGYPQTNPPTTSGHTQTGGPTGTGTPSTTTTPSSGTGGTGTGGTSGGQGTTGGGGTSTPSTGPTSTTGGTNPPLVP